MDFSVVWTRSAHVDFHAIIAYVAARSRKGARTIARAVRKQVDRLKRFPESGAAYEGDPSGRTRELIAGNLRIFYQLRPTARRAEITAVWHASRQEPPSPI